MRVGMVVIVFADRNIETEIEHDGKGEDDGDPVVIESIFCLGHDAQVKRQQDEAG